MPQSFPTGFNVTNSEPIDARIIKKSREHALGTSTEPIVDNSPIFQRIPLPQRYEGLSFYALNDKTTYRFVGGTADENLVAVDSGEFIKGIEVIESEENPQHSEEIPPNENGYIPLVLENLISKEEDNGLMINPDDGRFFAIKGGGGPGGDGVQDVQVGGNSVFNAATKVANIQISGAQDNVLEYRTGSGDVGLYVPTQGGGGDIDPADLISSDPNNSLVTGTDDKLLVSVGVNGVNPDGAGNIQIDTGVIYVDDSVEGKELLFDKINDLKEFLALWNNIVTVEKDVNGDPARIGFHYTAGVGVGESGYDFVSTMVTSQLFNQLFNHVNASPTASPNDRPHPEFWGNLGFNGGIWDPYNIEDHGLATRQWVNQTIVEMSGRYITFTDTGDELYPDFATVVSGPWHFQGGQISNIGELQNTDYAHYIQDDGGLQSIWRALFDGVNWTVGMKVSTESFTTAQNQAINSGITADAVNLLKKHIPFNSGISDPEQNPHEGYLTPFSHISDGAGNVVSRVASSGNATSNYGHVRFPSGVPSSANGLAAVPRGQLGSINVDSVTTTGMYTYSSITGGPTGIPNTGTLLVLQGDNGGVTQILCPSNTGMYIRTGTIGSLGTWSRCWTDGYSNVGDVNLASQVTGTLPVANGGTGKASVTNNHLLFGNNNTSALKSQLAYSTSDSSAMFHFNTNDATLTINFNPS